MKEGDRVRKGQLLAKIENTQPAADVESQKANLASAEADSAASEAGLKAADDNIATMQSAVTEAKADLDRMKEDSDRAEQLYNEKLGAKQDFDSKRSTVRSAEVRCRAGPGATGSGAQRSANRPPRS